MTDKPVRSMTRHRITTELSLELLEALTQAAEDAGQSKPEYIRGLLSRDLIDQPVEESPEEKKPVEELIPISPEIEARVKLELRDKRAGIMKALRYVIAETGLGVGAAKTLVDHYRQSAEARRYALSAGSSDKVRKAVSKGPREALRYAEQVDQGPHNVTRAGACGDPRMACLYALDVDKGPRDDTRKAACKEPVWAYCYALNVDKGPREDTRKAAAGHDALAFYYNRDLGETQHD